MQYKIKLIYQIFTKNVVAKPASVTADYYRLINPADPENILKYRIPSFTFAISPIATFGAVKIEDDMSPYRGPFYININNEKKFLKRAINSVCFDIYLSLDIFGVVLHGFLAKIKFLAPSTKVIKKHASEKNIKIFISDLHSGFDTTINNVI